MPGILTAEQIEKSLAKIVESASFEKAGRPVKFLEFVVRRAIRKPGESPPEAEIAQAVFGRADFDPRLDPIVRVEAARLRKRLEDYYAAEGKGDAVQIRLPPRGYLPQISTASDRPMEPECDEKRPGAMMLAVFPFANLSGDPQLDPFCPGLTEELISAVTALSNVSVVSRTTVSQYQGEPADLREVGRDLCVSHVLEGSVRQGEKVIRCTVNLIGTANGFTTWSKTFDISAEGDPLLLQASLAALIAEALEGEVQPAATTN